jgi:pimeloyl-ACP methyl ester carboxylesterase
MTLAVEEMGSVSTGEPLRRHRLLIDAGVSLDGVPAPKIAVEVCWHETAIDIATPLAFVCLPGGSINRHYYDLGLDAQSSFSFARHMAEQGMITLSVDHLGVGESTRPADGFALTPDLIVAANAHVTRQAVKGLMAGTLAPDLPPLPALATIGVGHSMGSLLTVMQHAHDPIHTALVLLGFSNAGLIDHLSEPARVLIGAPETIPERIVAIARQIYPAPYVEIPPSPEGSAMFYGTKADRDGVAALKAARDLLLVMPGLQSMIPGSIGPQLNKIDVPVFLGLGDQDIAGPPHAVAAAFSGSKDVTLIVLPETGHCHFIFPSRTVLFARIAEWAAMVRSGLLVR